MWARHITFDLAQPDLKILQEMVRESVEVKEHIVTEDPHEKGLRKALNLGHTVGHALETWAMRRQPVLHGYAVAWGLIAELYLSVIKADFPRDQFRQTEQFIRSYYGVAPTDCKDVDELLELMTHDKKNTAGTINFTLLSAIGDIKINQTATTKEIKESLDFQ
jgi:3-dehydroquinate synthase